MCGNMLELFLIVSSWELDLSRSKMLLAAQEGKGALVSH